MKLTKKQTELIEAINNTDGTTTNIRKYIGYRSNDNVNQIASPLIKKGVLKKEKTKRMIIREDYVTRYISLISGYGKNETKKHQ